MYNSEVVEKAENGEAILEIVIDVNADNPREYCDPVSTMFCSHGRYDLGDKAHYDIDDYNNWEEVRKAIQEDEDIVHILPLYIYDHSGITISTTPFSCKWDSGQVGWVYVTREAIVNVYGNDSSESIASAKICMDNEVREYDAYIKGDVYGFILRDKTTCKCCGNTHLEEVDSAYSFYGYDGLREAIKENIEEKYHSLVDNLDGVY